MGHKDYWNPNWQYWHRHYPGGHCGGRSGVFGKLIFFLIGLGVGVFAYRRHQIPKDAWEEMKATVPDASAGESEIRELAEKLKALEKKYRRDPGESSRESSE